MEPLYVVLIINLIVWAGLFGYIALTDKKINELKDKLNKIEKS
ncbi:MAG: CcmD family protein [Calditrichaceae bacterium]|jgi:CcmD family protein